MQWRRIEKWSNSHSKVRLISLVLFLIHQLFCHLPSGKRTAVMILTVGICNQNDFLTPSLSPGSSSSSKAGASSSDVRRPLSRRAPPIVAECHICGLLLKHPSKIQVTHIT